jgi:hypothetical protein
LGVASTVVSSNEGFDKEKFDGAGGRGSSMPGFYRIYYCIEKREAFGVRGDCSRFSWRESSGKPEHSKRFATLD